MNTALCNELAKIAPMHVSDLPERTQDYLKVLWDYEEHHGEGTPMALGELATALQQKLPTASEAVKRLAKQKLVVHERYFGVGLTPTGRELAVVMARRHRLLETFLVRTLGYSWDEVHAEADALEHATSDRFVDAIDAHLGHPVRDPHGDPIPRADGSSEPLSPQRLAQAEPGAEVILEQVNDSDPELLRYLDRFAVHPGSALRVVAAPMAGLLEVETSAGATFTVAEGVAQEMVVRPADKDS
ncbi:Iron-dependent repressor IdeR [Corynebacterium confusum]|nr:Iron-dependent repressor IdeR [Corynebacterium confusum]